MFLLFLVSLHNCKNHIKKGSSDETIMKDEMYSRGNLFFIIHPGSKGGLLTLAYCHF